MTPHVLLPCPQAPCILKYLFISTLHQIHFTSVSSTDQNRSFRVDIIHNALFGYWRNILKQNTDIYNNDNNNIQNDIYANIFIQWCYIFHILNVKLVRQGLYLQNIPRRQFNIGVSVNINIVYTTIDRHFLKIVSVHFFLVVSFFVCFVLNLLKLNMHLFK